MEVPYHLSSMVVSVWHAKAEKPLFHACCDNRTPDGPGSLISNIEIHRIQNTSV